MKKIGLIIGILLLITGCSKEKTFGLNESAYITNSQGEYMVEITNIERKTSKKNEKYVEVTFEVENISINDVLDKDEVNFLAYDKKGKACAAYLILGQNGLKANKGEKYQMKMGYVFNSDENYIKLDYYDSFKNGKSTSFVLEW